MEHTRFLRRLVIDAAYREEPEEIAPPMSDREREKSDKDHLEELCQRFDELHNEARQKFWDLMKIPVAPATIVAVVVEAAIVLAGFPKEVGYPIIALDVYWAIRKLITGLSARSSAVTGSGNAVTNIECFLHGRDSRTTMVFRDIINGHDPDLRQALWDAEFNEHKI